MSYYKRRPKQEPTQEIVEQTPEEKFLTTTDPEELQPIIDMFNLNIKKKNMIRANRVVEIQDKITSQIEERINKHADEFSNKDLLDYYKTMESTLKNDPGETELPTIRINQTNQININGSEQQGLNRQSRERVANVVRAILNGINGPQQLGIYDTFNNDPEPIVEIVDGEDSGGN